MQNVLKKLLSFSLLILISGDAFAWPPTYGTEFNFTNTTIQAGWSKRMRAGGANAQVPDETEQGFATKLAEKIKADCGDCTMRVHTGKFGSTEYEFKFKDGFGFNVSVDPACVEIQTFPATAEQVANQTELLQKHIFDPCKNIGLVADGNAHLNIGVLSAFEDNPKAFARLLADYSNRPELALGILGIDTYNAPLMEQLDIKQQRTFAKMLEDVNSGKIKTIREISQRMNYDVYTVSPDHGSSASSGRHYQAVGLKQLIKSEFSMHDMPFEFRAITQQKNSKEYQLLTQLMDKYLTHLRNRTDPIYYRTRSSPVVLSNAEQAAGFLALTEEIGEDWKPYAPLLESWYAENLRNGTAKKIIQGDFLVKGKNFDSFRKVIVDRFHTSPWIREQIKKVMLRKDLPAEVNQQIIQNLVKQSDESQSHAKAVNAFMAELATDAELLQDLNFKSEFDAAHETIQGRIAPEPVNTEKKSCSFLGYLKNIFSISKSPVNP